MDDPAANATRDDRQLSPSMHVLVSIVTYNSSGAIVDCLDHLTYLSGSHSFTVEVVVVDNASQDDTVAVVTTWISKHPDVPVKLVKSTTNTGWGAGNNLAIGHSAAQPDFVLLCNPDAYIDEQGLLALLQAMESRSDVGIAVPYISDTRGVHIGAQPERGMATLFFWDVIGRRWRRQLFERRFRARSGVFEVPHAYASGALALLRFTALQEAGFFDERIFLTSDDIDVSRSILRRGYRLVACREAVGGHEGGAGSRVIEAGPDDQVGSARLRLAIASELVFVEKWYGAPWARRLAWYRAHVFFPLQSAIRYIARKPAVADKTVREPAIEYLSRRAQQ